MFYILIRHPLTPRSLNFNNQSLLAPPFPTFHSAIYIQAYSNKGNVRLPHHCPQKYAVASDSAARRGRTSSLTLIGSAKCRRSRIQRQIQSSMVSSAAQLKFHLWLDRIHAIVLARPFKLPTIHRGAPLAPQFRKYAHSVSVNRTPKRKLYRHTLAITRWNRPLKAHCRTSEVSDSAGDKVKANSKLVK